MRMTEGKTLRGPAGTAIELHPVELDRPDQAATLATWWLECPGQSPAWSHYVLSIIHLRPIPGVKPAHVRVPGATHEVMLLALDPAKEPRPDDTATWSFLRPHNLMEQVQLPGDTEAVEMLELCIPLVLDGRLWAEAPLAGQVEPWRTVLIKTAAHARGEEHAP